MSMEAFKQEADGHAKAMNRMFFEKEQEVVKLRRHKFRLSQEKEELIKERDRLIEDLYRLQEKLEALRPHAILRKEAEEFFKDVFKEYRTARTFPPYHSNHEALGVILEEVAEVEECVFKNMPEDMLRTELLQVAVCCLKAVEDMEARGEEHGPSRTCKDSHCVRNCGSCGGCEKDAV